MKPIYGIDGGRPWPDYFHQYLAQAGFALRNTTPVELPQTLHSGQQPAAVVLQTPTLLGGQYLSADALWLRYFAQQAPQLKVLFAGYQTHHHPNYLDWLALPAHWDNFVDQAQPAHATWQAPLSDGVDLSEKLARFFTGHGQESVTALLNRLRMLVQMAQREVVDMGVPYHEAFTELVGPARLGHKWAEWQNRWHNYATYFQVAPFAGIFAQVEERIEPLGKWMEAEGRDQDLLQSGEALAILDDIKQLLTTLERTYVD